MTPSSSVSRFVRFIPPSDPSTFQRGRAQFIHSIYYRRVAEVSLFYRPGVYNEAVFFFLFFFFVSRSFERTNTANGDPDYDGFPFCIPGIVRYPIALPEVSFFWLFFVDINPSTTTSRLSRALRVASVAKNFFFSEGERSKKPLLFASVNVSWVQVRSRLHCKSRNDSNRN